MPNDVFKYYPEVLNNKYAKIRAEEKILEKENICMTST